MEAIFQDMNGLLRRAAASHIAASLTLILMVGCEEPVLPVMEPRTPEEPRPPEEPDPEKLLPDLTVTSPSVVSKQRCVGCEHVSFTLSATVRNRGEGSAEPTFLRYYMSGDATTLSREVGTAEIVGLGSGGSSTQSVSVKVSVSASLWEEGWYWVTCVDVVSNETDLTNNCSASNAAVDYGPVTISADHELRTFQYQGSGDHVLLLNPEGERLDDRLYTLEFGDLGALGADVYLVSTNATDLSVTPIIDLDATDARVNDQRTARRGQFPQTDSHHTQRHGSVQVPEVNPSLGAVRQFETASRQPVREGDTYVFRRVFHARGYTDVAATARRVVTDGTVTFVLWVENSLWGCGAACFDQSIIDAMADGFLRPGRDNDVYDWVTAVFGAPWGPHDSAYHIPAESSDEIHMLLGDIVPSGYFSTGNNRLRSWWSDSNERLMFFVSGRRLTHGEDWYTDDYVLASNLHIMAHEFQHVVFFYQKIIRNGLDLRKVDRHTLMNEMASGVAQILAYFKFRWQKPDWYKDDRNLGGSSGSVEQDYSLTDTTHVHYSILEMLGIYLALNYGGVSLIGDIVRNEQTGIDAIEDALAARGHAVSFGDVLANWAVATLLADNHRAPVPVRYNSGSWSVSEAGGVTFRIAPLTVSYYAGSFFSVAEFNAEGAQPPHSNRFADLGRIHGTVRLRVNAVRGNRITLVVKE